ncbi:hypothetical protein KU735_22790, partial [Salmonella enterica subsp. enterica serovar Give]|nr:hypothetical protein [Salmonella enterica subsp. enterica serovar Give]
LCAEQNMQVCVPSTPAQVYHMLRRQALRGMRRPLVVMSPKSLQHHQTAHPAPFLLAGGDELVNHYLRAVGKIAKLRFPDSQGTW